MPYPSTFELPTTEVLTGLANEPYARYLLREQLLPAAVRDGAPLSLLLLDMDAFLPLNQRFGRRCGDHFLIHVARALQTTMPESAVLARFGGDEFVAGLPHTRLDDAFTLAEEARRRVEALRLEPWPQARITCTIGLASFPTHGKRLPELLREADQALYVAKLQGRNKVALPLAEGRMITKTSYYTATQLERLAQLARRVQRNEASLLREALDDVLKHYNDMLGGPPAEDASSALDSHSPPTEGA
ncbi:MAG TPA: diguanylate cyclase [Chloroflexota bacterium]|nr:diguanylate cyclase [Chloroflexota bacterium]